MTTTTENRGNTNTSASVGSAPARTARRRVGRLVAAAGLAAALVGTGVLVADVLEAETEDAPRVVIPAPYNDLPDVRLLSVTVPSTTRT